MGTVKLEFDLPEFKDQVEVKITVSKDGVLSTPPAIKINDVDKGTIQQDSSGAWKQQYIPNTTTATQYKEQLTATYQSHQTNSSNIPKSMTGEY